MNLKETGVKVWTGFDSGQGPMAASCEQVMKMQVP
jgi:hypothetical protein